MALPILIGVKLLLKRFAIVAVQSLLAALAEETTIPADKAGFRGKDGTFKSKRYAILRVILFIATIGFIVQYLPALLDLVFINTLIQSFGLAIILGDVVVHTFVDNWDPWEDYLAFLIGGCLLLSPYLLTAI